MSRCFVAAEKKKQLRLGLALFVICISWLMAGMVQASQADTTLDLSRKGGITVTVKENNTPVPGGTMTIYKVASLVQDNGYWFAYTDDFKDFGTAALTSKYSSSYNPGYVSQDVFATDNAASGLYGANWAMAEDLESYINNGAAKIEALGKKDLGTEGIQTGYAIFDRLEPGLYLFIQEDPADGYYPVGSFLVTMPSQDANGGYVYTVDASPKALITIQGSQDNSVSVNPEIRKRVVSTGTDAEELTNKDLPDGTYFDFKFEALDASYPMPVNAKGSVKNGGPVVSQSGTAVQLRVDGIGTIQIGTITFTEEGEYYYKLEEMACADSDFERDPQVYSLVYFVTKSATGSSLVVSCEVHDEDANGQKLSSEISPTLEFTNRYNPEEETETETEKGKGGNTPGGTLDGGGGNSGNTGGSGNSGGSGSSVPSRLPQTGQLWWPIWILIAAGVVLIAAGMVLKRRKEI